MLKKGTNKEKEEKKKKGTNNFRNEKGHHYRWNRY